MNKSSLLFSLGLFFSLVGCRSYSKIELGTWQGYLHENLPEKTTRDLAHTIKKVSLTLYPRGKFLLLQLGAPLEGDFFILKNSLVLKPDRFFGRPLGQTFYQGPKTLHLKILEDHSLLFQSDQISHSPIKVSKIEL